MNPIGPVPDPDLRALLLAHRSELFAALNCHQVGEIVAFDAAKQTARVQLSIRRVVYNKPQPLGAGLQLDPEFVDYPVLVDVPVFVNSGGGAVATLPVAAGDSCLVLFADRDVDNWFEAGGTAAPNSARLHDLSDGFALVGFRNKTNPVEDYSTTDAEIRNAGGKIQVAAKIGISNDATSLLVCLDALITALTAWVDTGGQTPNGATVTALNAVKTQIDSLLK